ncbi:MAG: hypothetical protein ACOVQA_07580 [Thermoflexibacteraceae bacterium]
MGQSPNFAGKLQSYREKFVGLLYKMIGQTEIINHVFVNRSKITYFYLVDE